MSGQPERLRRSENGGPVVLDADDGPAGGLRSFECLFRAGCVVELALCVVVADEQAQTRLVGMLAEVEQRDVAVRVPASKKRAAARATPDPDRLLWAVVEVVGLGLVPDRAAVVVARVLER